MKQVYLAADMVEAHMIKDYLEGAGIEAMVHGALLTGAIGEIPANTYPTVWVVDDADYHLAKDRIADYLSAEPSDQLYKDRWTCPECGQALEPQFTQCWHCGAYRR